jgi:hypothetical protein
MAACLVFDPSRKTRVHLIPRSGGGAAAAAGAAPRVFETDPFFSFHSGNAFELNSKAAGSTGGSTITPSNGSSTTGSSTNGSSTKGSSTVPSGADTVVVDLVAWQGIDFENFNYDVLDIDSPGSGGGGQLDPSYYA